MRTPLRLLLILFLLSPAPAYAMNFVTVGLTNNPPDDETACQAGTTLICRSNIGAVPYTFQIAATEVTNQEYVDFLNAVATSDPNGLFNLGMQTQIGEISRFGSSGSYTYEATPGFEDRPVRYIDWFRALRFANWWHNGMPLGPQGPATTEDGAYTLLGANPPDVVRNPGARYWLPSEDEWYKAAFYDPLIGWYHDYPTGSDVPPAGEVPPGSTNAANLCPLSVSEGGPASCEDGKSDGPGHTTDVGSYVNSPSPWGTFDQIGNVWEFLEDRVRDTPTPTAAIRGSVFFRGPADGAAFSRSDAPIVCQGCSGIGFRLARKAPSRRCGLGFEAALALPVVMVLRGLRRRARARL
jgi:formylglycine-generating enzyme